MCSSTCSCNDSKRVKRAREFWWLTGNSPEDAARKARDNERREYEEERRDWDPQKC